MSLVTEIYNRFFGHLLANCAQDGYATNAGVEDANGGIGCDGHREMRGAI
jgi:hypothetical protein